MNLVSTRSGCKAGVSKRQTVLMLLLILVLPFLFCACSVQSRPVVPVTGVKKGVDPVMGDWQGYYKEEGKGKSPMVAQIIALGDKKYQAKLYPAFDKRTKPIAVLEGQFTKRGMKLQGKCRKCKWTGSISKSGKMWLPEPIYQGLEFLGKCEGEKEGIFVMHQVLRPSPTLQAKPPVGAIVLFDGKNLDAWKHPEKFGQDKLLCKIVDGVLQIQSGKDDFSGSIVSKRNFKDFKLHVEFRTEFLPEARGQARSNSGVYLQGRYEVQVLDSYGLEGLHNECGGIYNTAHPSVNACAPPLQWQTFDITFSAPRFDISGEKTKNARATIYLNGVKVHDNVEILRPTGAGVDNNEGKHGGIFLQDHGHPMEFRNIWVLPLP